MLRYNRERHLELLRERLAAVTMAAPGKESVPTHQADVAADEREELMRLLMVRGLGRLHRGQQAEPREFARALDTYLECCDPTDLRQVDVLHNLYEGVSGRHLSGETLVGMWRRYSELLRRHVDRLAAGQIQGHRVGPGERTTIAPNGGPLRVLLLADNFLSGRRIWERILVDSATAQLRLLFCNNARQPSFVYLSWLIASLARLVASDGLRAGVSMLRSRPRVSTRPLCHSSNTAWLRLQAFDVGLHSMGVIYRQETIHSFKRGILNAHIGHLPGMRGRSVLEWSLVLGVEPCVSTFFIDEGIDTGDLIVDRYVPPPELVHEASMTEQARRRMFDLDGFCYQRALTRLVQGGDGVRNVPPGPRFFVMSRLLAASIGAGAPTPSGARLPVTSDRAVRDDLA